MEKLLIGLAGFSIKKVLSYRPPCIKVTYKKDTLCPECNSSDKRIKASFWREIKSVPQQGSPIILHIRCHKFHCKKCSRYFNNRMNGIISKDGRDLQNHSRTVFSINVIAAISTRMPLLRVE